MAVSIYSSAVYELIDTGQGLQRVQKNCPRISRAMRELLHDQQLLAHRGSSTEDAGKSQYRGGWVGSSVIHIGDANVPNSLSFIDKYNQVSRILQPIVQTIEQLSPDKLCKDRITRQCVCLSIACGLLLNAVRRRYIDDTFGGAEKLKRTILSDFFRGGFDGSGADNFFDAGSCIDGRLTSAWNWCSSLESKPFFPVFLLAGFTGFDGSFSAKD